LWRERAFLLEQLREQYLLFGAAVFTHSHHAHLDRTSLVSATEVKLGFTFLGRGRAGASENFIRGGSF
jgi:hypothetical protein